MGIGEIAALLGLSVVMGSYLDRKLFLSHDLATVKKLLPLLADMKNALKNELTVADIWERTCKANYNKAAIVFEGKEHTFKEIDQESNKISHWAASKGLKKGDVVALYMENKPEFIITWLGLAKIGVVIAFINCNLTGKGLVHCVKISNAKYLIFGHESTPAIEESIEMLEKEYQKIPYASYGGEVSFAEHIDAQLPNHSSETPPKSVRKGLTPADIWGLVYTSGTTGLPKAAVIKHVRFFAGGLFAAIYSVTNQDRLYTALPLYHSAGGMIGVGIMVYCGATLLLRRKFSATNFISDLKEGKATAFQYIGELCRYLLATEVKPGEKDHQVRIAIGNGLRPDIWEAFQTRFNIPYIGEFYAATEGNAGLYNCVPLSGEGRGAIGRKGWLLKQVMPTKLVKFDVATENPIRGKDGFCIECEPGEVGEFLGFIDTTDPVKDFAGYYNNKSGSDKKVLRNVFKKGDAYFRTGDLLKTDEKGYYYFVDRIGDTFRWKGENVSTTEVAEAISVYPGIGEANVYGVEVPGADGRAGMAAVVAKPNLDFAGLAAHLIKELPSYAVPLFLRILPEMEITGTFKHRKVELRAEGFNPSVVPDPIYYLNPSTKTYEPLDPPTFNTLYAVKAKL